MILAREKNLAEEINARIETELEVKAYIQDLKYALNNDAQIEFQVKRRVDEDREEKSFTPDMFPYRKN